MFNKYFINKSVLTLKYKSIMLEKDYKSSMYEFKFLQMRYAPFLTSFFYIWFYFLDFEVTNGLQLEKVQYFHISMVIILITPFIFSFLSFLKKFVYYILLIAPLYAAIGSIYMVSLNMNVYLPDIYLIMIWSFVMAGFYFFESLIVNIIMILFTIIFYSMFDILSIYYFEIHAVYMLIAFVIGIFASYSIELSSRINFEVNNQLKEQQLEIQKFAFEIASVHKHTKESIEYAALIQGSLVPNTKGIEKYFKDQFIIWNPKDTVGGDIYLFEELRTSDECLLMVIDCTGHGVPGAFLTMLVKAIERQIITKINNSDEVVSPSEILMFFNKQLKELLKLENKESTANVGFDGQIVYFNKKDKIVKISSARNEIFYYQDNELHVIKGDRRSIGYKNNDTDYIFKEHSIDISQETIFYFSTDGFLDQNGGHKGFPYGKSKLKKILSFIYKDSMDKQKEKLLLELNNYQAKYETNDDITIIGLKV